MRGTFSLLNEDLCLTKSTIELYIRISYFGDSLITEMESPESIRKAFYARDETGDDYIYQFRELSVEQLQSGGWDSCIFSSNPNERDRLICDCKEFERLKKLLGANPNLLAMLTGKGEDEDDDETEKGLAMGGKGGLADLDKDKSKKKRDSRMSKAKNELEEYLKAEAEHWKLLMEMLALAKSAPKGLSPSVGTRKVSAVPCVSVLPCQPCQPCMPCSPCQSCQPCPPCYITTSCSPCG